MSALIQQRTWHRKASRHFQRQLSLSYTNLLQVPIELRKRLEEIRLLESRKSARLADVDTDFARLADMAGDRRRASATIEVPAHHMQGYKLLQIKTTAAFYILISWTYFYVLISYAIVFRIKISYCVVYLRSLIGDKVLLITVSHYDRYNPITVCNLDST